MERDAGRRETFWRARGGLAAVEFALVLPIAVAMLFGEFVLGEALSINRKVSIASRAIGDLVARNSLVARTTAIANQYTPAIADLSAIMNASTQIAAPYATSSMGVVVAELTTDGSGITTITWSAAQNATALTVGNAFSPPAGIAQANSSLIYTKVTYSYTPPVGQNIFGTIPISNTFYMPPRTSAAVSCVGC
jgi:Flp pilus assembly protein TadG